MRSKLLFLILMLAGLLLVSSVQANMMTNSSFETGTWTAETDIRDDWWTWGDGATNWMSGDTAEG